MENAAAFVTDHIQKRKDRCLVNASDPQNCAETHSLGEESDNLGGLFSLNIVPYGRLSAGFGRRGIASGTAIKLDPTASVKSETICLLVLTSNASHRTFSLVFYGRSPTSNFADSSAGFARV
jgi:hypothetical protein